MFRPVRKKKNEIDIVAINSLKKCRRGVLALNVDDGYPYAIPINFYLIKMIIKYIFMGHALDTK